VLEEAGYDVDTLIDGVRWSWNDEPVQISSSLNGCVSFRNVCPQVLADISGGPGVLLLDRIDGIDSPKSTPS